MTNQITTINANELEQKIDTTLKNLRDNFDTTNLTKEDKLVVLEKLKQRKNWQNILKLE